MHSMAYWVVAFGGERAVARYKEALQNCAVTIHNPAAPVGQVRVGDKVLLCAAGVGFVGTATVVAQAVSPADPEDRKPLLRLAGVEEFPEPVVYSFPSSGPHPVLGFEPKALSTGLLTIARKGYLHVYDRAWGMSEPVTPANRKNIGENKKDNSVGRPGTLRKKTPKPAQRRAANAGRSPGAAGAPSDGKPGRTGAGRHAMGEYNNLKGRWTFWGKVARLFFGDGLASRYADKRVEKAKKTWGVGARAEVAVGDELESLKEHGFVLIHDLRIQGIGNIDHVAIGPQGIFAIETKSHRGVVSVGGNEIRPVLLLRGTTPGKDFIGQARRGADALSNLLAEKGWFSIRKPRVVPVLCFTRAWLEERYFILDSVFVTKVNWLAEALAWGKPALSRSEIEKHLRRLRSLSR